MKGWIKKMYMKVENMETNEGRAIPNQFIIKRDGETCFQSYHSLIAIWDGDKLTLGKDWDYSVTTSKYLYRFIDEYCYKISHLLPDKGKRAAVNKLIESGDIIYDPNMQ
jgi:hypothetical protein